MSAVATLRQVCDATIMDLRGALRDLGGLIAFIVIFPIGFLFFLGEIVQASERLQVLVGSVMMEMALLNVNAVAQSIGQDKQSKLYDLWVSLPMSPVVYVSAIALSFLPISLISAAITLAIGIVWFGLPAVSLAGLFGGLLLVWASTLGIGFLIAVYGRSPRQINTNANFIGIVMTFFAPIFYPLSVLPLPLQYVAEAWPLTWGALLLKSILNGVNALTLEYAGVLLGFSALWLVLIAVGLRWREP